MLLWAKTLISHPYFFALVFAVFAIIYGAVKKKTALGLGLLLIALSFILITTPYGSIWLLNKLNHLAVDVPEYCDEAVEKPSILLPGGLFTEDGELFLTHWSMRRAALVIDLYEQGLTNQVYVPGGYETEGEYLEKHLKQVTDLDVIVGTGSSSTYSNFLELQDQLDNELPYWLVTSYWHYPRASRVAYQLGLKVCPIITSELIPKARFYHRDAHWQGKIAIHEFMAFIYYLLTNRI